MIGQRLNDGWTCQNTTGGTDFLHAAAAPDVPVMLPHDAAVHEARTPDSDGGSQKGYWPNGSYTYTKYLYVPAEQDGKALTLFFEGAYKEAEVYVNDMCVGTHANGYTEFAVPISDALKYDADNLIQVSLRSGKDSRWYAPAGLYRNVWLYTADEVYIPIHGIRLRTESAYPEVATVVADVQIVNRSPRRRSVIAKITLTDAAGSEAACDHQLITIGAGKEETVHTRIYVAEPKLWNVDSPDTYRVTVTLYEAAFDPENEIVSERQALAAGDAPVLDTAVVETFGIRVLSLDNVRGLAINGKSVKLYGGCIHHDNGIIGAATIEAAEERRIRLLKEAGYNAIRSAHNPVSRGILAACDRYGVLVMDELTDMWNRGKTADDYSHHFPTGWREDVKAVVNKDYNHPSVIMYSCGNEISEVGTPAGAAVMRGIAAAFRELDPFRYTTAGTNNMLACMNEVRKFAAQMMAGPETGDAASGSEDAPASGSEDAAPEIGDEINAAMVDMGEMMKQGQVLPGVVAGTHESYAQLDIAGYNYADNRYTWDKALFDNWISVGSETFPRDLHRNWSLVSEHADVLGDFTWTSWDYLGEAGIGKYIYKNVPRTGEAMYSAYPYRLAWDADFDITGTKTPQGYYREIVMGVKKGPFIAVQDPADYEKEPMIDGWSWSVHDTSWTWNGHEGRPVRVEVYGLGERAELLVNGRSVGCLDIPAESASGMPAGRVVFDTVYEPGTLTAILYQDGAEIGRNELATAGPAAALRMTPDKTESLRTDGSDLVYIDIDLVDEDGRVNAFDNRPVTVTVTGAGVLQGMGTGNPECEENFYDTTIMTFGGHLTAAIRPVSSGDIRVEAVSEGLKGASVELQAG